MDIEETVKPKRKYTKWQGLRVRCSHADRAAIETKAAAAGMKLSGFVRNMARNGKVVPVVPSDVRKAISGFSRNLNQLSHWCNTQKDSPAAEALESLKAEAFRIISAINSRGKE